MPAERVSKAFTPLSLHIPDTGTILSRPRLSCITSLGTILPIAAREMILSRSPIPPIRSLTLSRCSSFFVK